MMGKIQGLRRPGIFSFPLAVIITLGLFSCDSSYVGKKPVYRSSAIIEIKQSSPELFAASEGLLPDQKTRGIRKAILRVTSRSVVESIMEELDLDEDINNETERGLLIDKIRDGIEITMSSPDIIKFNVTYDEPVACQKIVNLLMRKIIKEELYRGDKETEANIEWLMKELELWRKKLTRSEEILDSFREDNRDIILDLEAGYSSEPAGLSSATKIIAHRRTQYSQDLLDSEIEYRALKAEEKALAGDLAEMDEMIVTEKKTAPGTGEVISITESLNPVYRDLQLDLIRTRRKIAGTEVRMNEIKTIAEGLDKKLQESPEKEKEYARLRREYNNCADMHAKLEKMKEKVYLKRRLDLEERGVRFCILDNAEIPLEPYKPD